MSVTPWVFSGNVASSFVVYSCSLCVPLSCADETLKSAPSSHLSCNIQASVRISNHCTPNFEQCKATLTGWCVYENKKNNASVHRKGNTTSLWTAGCTPLSRQQLHRHGCLIQGALLGLPPNTTLCLSERVVRCTSAPTRQESGSVTPDPTTRVSRQRWKPPGFGPAASAQCNKPP